MQVKNLMTKDLLTVGPYTPILSAVEILVHKRFNGVPVVDKNKKLLGLLTQHDMMLRGTDMHLPTLIHILTDVGTYGRDRKFMSSDMQKIAQMKTADVMNKNPMTLHENDPVEKALSVFSEHHDVNPILILDEKEDLVGLLSRYDMIKLFGKQTDVEHELHSPDRDIDLMMRQTLPNFEKKFVFVSRMRATHWLLVSLASGVIGFVVALFFMLRLV